MEHYEAACFGGHLDATLEAVEPDWWAAVRQPSCAPTKLCTNQAGASPPGTEESRPSLVGRSATHRNVRVSFPLSFAEGMGQDIALCTTCDQHGFANHHCQKNTIANILQTFNLNLTNHPKAKGGGGVVQVS